MKSIPIRRCIGCMTGNEKKTLIRIVKDKEGNIFIDQTGKANGRGAYICKNAQCLAKAKAKKQLERAFKSPVSQAIYLKLEQELTDYES